jgi:hypothetical protein
MIELLFGAGIALLISLLAWSDQIRGRVTNAHVIIINKKFKDSFKLLIYRGLHLNRATNKILL